MSWTKNDYPNSMKNLPEATRNKAIEIANALLDDQYDEGRAIAIATSQAEKMKNENQEMYHVVPHDDKWAIKKENSNEVDEIFTTKQEAMEKGHSLIKTEDVHLTIHRQDGTIERVQNQGS
ncbi:DUF2188 domain-containing protein [Bacillus weihaiensis]|uniref:DUF2188 domain-containing protein n=1 Tax=Bacillus weihaiensis TaxID=1547283 RepID=A0A1L3MNM1_9BACI|nr:DUF2188 domain-containing protein [Bacillus weihaiensis]APH03947.1 hypothetical protein A9C19_03760 [Bacillus weihaiensis]